MADQMRFVSAASLETDVDAALDELAGDVRASFAKESPDLILVFISSYFVNSAREIAAGLRRRLQPKALLGCSAEGVIGRDQEIEEEAAIALIAAQLPGVTVAPFLLDPIDWSGTLSDPEEFSRFVPVPDGSKLFLMLGDPFSTPMDLVLQVFNRRYPEIPVMGGMASSALRPGGNVLLLNEELLNSGLVGVALSGAFKADVIVSQGCRPIGEPLKVTAAARNVMLSLEGDSPLACLEEIIEALEPEERDLLQGGLFVGKAVSKDIDNLGRGDYLIRGVVGADQEKGAIAIGDSLEAGEIIQFHLRDAITAKEDLEMMLIPQVFREPPSGALLFTCNGRGLHLYDHPNGDISVIQKNLGEIHLAGLFCAGEIGPIGGKNYLHGHTASLVLFRPAN